MVYDRELKYVRQITGRSKTRLQHLHPDCHGNLYISSTLFVACGQGSGVSSEGPNNPTNSQLAKDCKHVSIILHHVIVIIVREFTI